MEAYIPKQQKLTNWEKTYLWLIGIFIITAIASFILRFAFKQAVWVCLLKILVLHTDLMIPYICANLIMLMVLFDLYGRKLIALNVRRRYVGFLMLIGHILFLACMALPTNFSENMGVANYQLIYAEVWILAIWIMIMPFDLIGTYVIKPLIKRIYQWK